MVVFALFKLLDPVECFRADRKGIFYAYVIRDSEIYAPMIAVILKKPWALDGAKSELVK